MIETAICVECGAEFNRRLETTIRCPRCSKRLSKKKNREKKKAELEALKKLPPKVCPFCGKKFHSRAEEYCRTCLEEGFNNVHKMFGSTNGWDRKARKPVEIKDGWRGNGVVGWNTSRGRFCE